MHPCHACEEMRRVDPSVGSSSGGRDQAEGPSGALNLECYNSRDRHMRLNMIYRINV